MSLSNAEFILGPYFEVSHTLDLLTYPEYKMGSLLLSLVFHNVIVV